MTSASLADLTDADKAKLPIATPLGLVATPLGLATWQDLINKYGVDFAFDVLMLLFHQRETLEQPSPNVSFPTKATSNTTGNSDADEGYEHKAAGAEEVT